MTTQTEALKSAIEFAEYCLEELDLSHMASNQAKRLVQKSKEALSSPNGEAQPAVALEQEPAFHGFMDEQQCCVNICYTPWAAGGPNNKLPTAYYTAPPKHTWVGLTKQEIRNEIDRLQNNRVNATPTQKAKITKEVTRLWNLLKATKE